MTDSETLGAYVARLEAVAAAYREWAEAVRTWRMEGDDRAIDNCERRAEAWLAEQEQEATE